MNEIDFEYWSGVYMDEYKKYIAYINDNGESVKDYSPFFESISKTLRKRGFLFKEEFISICEWKSPRPRPKYTSNSEEEVKEKTKIAIASYPNIEEQIQELTLLNGVGIPMASTILTVIFPEDYCVVDYHACKALAWLAAKYDIEDYHTISNILENLRNNFVLDTYTYTDYLRLIRKVAKEYNLSARKVEMALWAFDRTKHK